MTSPIRSRSFRFVMLLVLALGCATTGTEPFDDGGRVDVRDAEGGADGDADDDGAGEADGEEDDGGGPPGCDGPDDCGGGPCVDGFCCDRACDGTCEACDILGFEGTCRFVPVGRDPDEECIEEFPSTCGMNGSCNGAGSCGMHGAETACDDADPCTARDVCTGTGACRGETPTACEPGAGDECCIGACAAGSGCYTQTGECAEACGVDRLTVGQICAGCGPAGAVGLCTGGAVHACTAADHRLCQEVTCGGATYRCTSVGGTWGWRTAVACDDGDGCTYSDACVAGSCVGTSYACVSDACMSRTCDGAGVCDEDPLPPTADCGTVACPADTCSGTTWRDYPATCTSRCDGSGTCVTCACSATSTACAVGAANECCAPACTAATGCATVPGSCGSGDSCVDPYVKTVGSVCGGCGAAGANGVCGGGGSFTCNAASHVECQTVSCGGTTYYCPRVGGAWQWRSSAACDDGDACTWGDACGASGCRGTAIVCTSTDCVTRSCNGTSACTETPRPSGTPCGGTSCAADSCSGGSFYDYPGSCSSACDGSGSCAPCSCTPTVTACTVGSTNECCVSTCDGGSGCGTAGGSCADQCGDPYVLTTTRSCGGCLLNGASGTCGGGAVRTCNASSHTLCQAAVCGGLTYTCANQGGTWRWRAGDARCDDGNLCTYNDGCSGLVCAGAPVSCASTPPCITRACNGTATCTETYNTGVGCDDGNACTTGETCGSTGACGGGTSTAVCPDGACTCGETSVSCPADCGTSCPSALSLATWDVGDDGWTYGGLWRRTSGYMRAGSTTSYCGSYTQNLTSGTDVDLSGCATATLRFSVRLDDDAAYSPDSDRSERLFVECSGDSGVAWTSLTPSPWPSNQSACSTSYCDGGEGLDRGFSWTTQAIVLPAACRTARARFRLRATGACVWRIWYWFVDSVSLN